MKRLRMPAHGVPLLILRTTGDEASGILLASHFVSFVVHTAYRVAATLPVLALGLVCLAVGYVARNCFWFLGLMVALFIAMVTLLSWVAANLLWWLPVGGAAVVLLSVVLQWLVGFGFGIVAPWVEISVETTPPGEWVVHNVAPRRRMPTEAEDANHTVPESFFAHSAAYNDPEALSILTAWINVLLRAGR